MNTEAQFMAGIFVSLDEQVVERLLSLRAAGESLADVIDRLCNREEGNADSREMPSATKPMGGKYKAMFLGQTVHAQTLPYLFAQIVDLLADIDPEALERLADMKARTRSYIARKGDAIHPDRPDLPVICTRTGWWISANVGKEDIVRSLRALANAAGLSFGRDIQFPVGTN